MLLQYDVQVADSVVDLIGILDRSNAKNGGSLISNFESRVVAATPDSHPDDSVILHQRWSRRPYRVGVVASGPSVSASGTDGHNRGQGSIPDAR